MKVRVYYEDTDLGGIVYHSKYLNFCERARSEIFFSAGKSPIYQGYHFVVKEIVANFENPAFFGDILEVKTTLLELKNASFSLLQEIFKEEKRCFKMEVKLVCLKNGRPVKIPPYFLDLLQPLQN
ncbi:MAG: acyl-CoA thioesterase [Epsilonproteobacteria bacterium]|nr:acyl-CoA thioesterase [Campylobacterota bacterium]